jgi:F420-0:gamma-glutamyl ligase
MNLTNQEVVDQLRSIANAIASVSGADIPAVMFPGWHEGFEETNERLIKEAASAILAEGITEDESIVVSLKSIAALLHYVGDMMED